MYVRTKNRIYKVENETCGKQGYFIGECEVILKDQVINQADTIEELCDEYVITCVEDYEYKCFYPKIADINAALEYATEDVYIVYGAIWTDKGLIYVAKMNDTGELELI